MPTTIEATSDHARTRWARCGEEFEPLSGVYSSAMIGIVGEFRALSAR
jgi:hypothetical protein